MRDALSALNRAREIRTTKANDMRGVFTPTTRDFAVWLACAAMALATITAVVSQREEARQFQQEARV